MKNEVIKNQEVVDNRAKWKEILAEDAVFYATSAKESELSFRKRLESLDGENMSMQEFEKWEDDFSSSYNTAYRKAYENYTNFGDVCDKLAKSVAYEGAGRESDLRKTIEAQAGKFFPERRLKLIEAIESSDKTNDQKAEDKKLIEKFVESVYQHMDLKNIEPAEVADYGYQRYENDRTHVHNKTMKALNDLNDLSKEYHLRPFTVRNFCPSDVVEAKRQTPAESIIMRYDRDIVEEYYALAFPEEAKRAEARWRRYERFGI